MLRLAKIIKPWTEAGSLNANINLYGFWDETTFLTKSGDLGMVLKVCGVDFESLDQAAQEFAVKRLEAALKSFGPGFHIYQYLFKTNRPDMPFARYGDPLIDAAIDQRREFFESKRDHLFEIEIYYAVVLEGARSKTGIMAALGRLPSDPEGALRELKAQFTNDVMKVLLRTQIQRDLLRLKQRVEAIAKDYVARPENTLIVSPDNASRRDINDAVRAELQNSGALSKENHPMTVLTQRSELTSADRNWAAMYQPADVLYYTRGSQELGIDRGTYATVVSTNPKDNQLTVERQDGQHVTYNPERLHGIAAYREIIREFSEGDRIQLTVSKPDMDVKNRDLGTIERIEGTTMSVRMDGEKERILTFDSSQMRHFDHGYAVTSHSSQGLTTDRVLVNMDTTTHPELINTRFAYVSVSRASQDARIYTNDVANLAERLSTDISKASAVEISSRRSEVQSQQPTPKEQTMINTREQTQEEQRRQFQHEARNPANNNTQAQNEIDLRHYAPIQTALPNEASGYDWKRETGDIQSYQHNQTSGWLHVDPQGQFYDRQAQPIARDQALEQAGHSQISNPNDVWQSQSVAKVGVDNDQGLSL
jgi:hypothetical protein